MQTAQSADEMRKDVACDVECIMVYIAISSGLF